MIPQKLKLLMNFFETFPECSLPSTVSKNTTSETISDSAECYAGLSVRFESSAACMELVSSRPKNNLQLLFVKMVRVTVVIYIEFRSF